MSAATNAVFTAPPPPVAFSPVRAGVVLVLLVACFLALGGRVAYLQTYGRAQTLAHAERQHHAKRTVLARRGGIFDRNGLEMAGTIQTQTVFVDPQFMQESFDRRGLTVDEADEAVARLAELIGRDSFDLAVQLSDNFDNRFVKVAENLDEARCQQVLELNLPGVGLVPTNVRYYPMGTLAAHLLGGTGKDGRGLEGLELRFNNLLTGTDGWERSLKDSRHRSIGIEAEDYVPPRHGRHLMLTVDANIQLIAEQELARVCKDFSAKGGEVVVMEPNTGEVLALANWPTYKPKDLGKTNKDVRRNRCLTDPYEPGSTIKPFIVGPALSWRETKVNEVWPVNGPRYKAPYGRRWITDVHGYERLSTWDGLVKSSNILMSMLAERMGNPRLHAAIKAWDFGKPTGIELPGEDGGLVNPLKKWTKYSTESVAQGYELMVTPLQLARGFCAYANGGRLVKPTLVKGVLDSEGRLVSSNRPADLDLVPAVLDEATADQVRQILSDTVVRGTATKARSEVWNIFGKTGTAHISQGRGGYNNASYTSSFLAGAPLEDPRIVVAFIIHEPDKTKAHYGGKVSAPAAKLLIERVLSYLQTPPSPELNPPPAWLAATLYNFDAKAYRRKAVAANAADGD